MEDQNTARIKEIKRYLAHFEEERKISSLHLRPFKYSKSSHERKILSLSKDLKHSILSKSILRNELRDILLNIDEIKNLPQKILELTHFNQFETCHLLVHEKGKPVGQNYFNHYVDDGISKPITVQNFNNLYNLVKKSKNKNFNQSITLKDDLDLVGNFLAKEIDLRNHSVLFLLSRNSFLPPSSDEQLNFLSLSSFLSPLLSKILDREKNDFKKEILIRAIKNFPEKIYVKDQNRTIFTNDKDNSKKEDLNLISFPLGSTDGLTMELSNLSRDTISTEIYHSQRISLLGELLNTLQHELSNPLFGLNLTSSLLKSEAKDAEILETLNDICTNAARSQTIIKNFSNLYNDQQEFKILNIIKLVEETLTLTKSESKEIPKEIICIGFDRNIGLEINSNPTYLTQIIFNLIINAAQAIKNNSQTPHKHKILITLEKLPNQFNLSISDDGPGVKTELVQDLFKPFFTTKESGTGLGLSICRNLAAQLNGEIHFKNNSPLPGVTFSLNLPM